VTNLGVTDQPLRVPFSTVTSAGPQTEAPAPQVLYPADAPTWTAEDGQWVGLCPAGETLIIHGRSQG